MSSVTGIVEFMEVAQGASSSDYLKIERGGLTLGQTSCLDYFRCLSAAEVEENRKAWGIFAAVARKTYGEERLSRLCVRYQFDLEQTANSGQPLLRWHIDMVTLGAVADLRTTDIEKVAKKSLALLNATGIQQEVERLNPHSTISREVQAKGLQWYFFADLVSMDQERLHLMQNLGNIPNPDGYYERLAKSIANLELEPKMLLPALTLTGEIDFYEVYCEINRGKGLGAYALRPISKSSTLQPLLVFSPSKILLNREDSFQTWLNDCEENIGSTGYLDAREALQALMKDDRFKPEGQKIILIGASLGGTQAQMFLKDHWRQIEKAVFFNDPSVQASLAEALAEEINGEPETGKNRMKMVVYRSVYSDRKKGDITHFGGKKHVGEGICNPDFEVRVVEVQPVGSDSLSIFEMHAGRHIDGTTPIQSKTVFEGKEAQIELDNAKRGDEVLWYEGLRLCLGPRFLYYIIYGVWSVLRTISDFFGIEIFKKKRTITSEN